MFTVKPSPQSFPCWRTPKAHLVAIPGPPLPKLMAPPPCAPIPCSTFSRSPRPFSPCSPCFPFLRLPTSHAPDTKSMPPAPLSPAYDPSAPSPLLAPPSPLLPSPPLHASLFIFVAYAPPAPPAHLRSPAGCPLSMLSNSCIEGDHELLLDHPSWRSLCYRLKLPQPLRLFMALPSPLFLFPLPTAPSLTFPC